MKDAVEKIVEILVINIEAVGIFLRVRNTHEFSISDKMSTLQDLNNLCYF